MTRPPDAPRLRDQFDAHEAVPDGALVAIGGIGTSRKPMDLLRTLVRAGVRELRIISALGSVDVDYLLAAGCVAEVHTAGVAIDGVGLAPVYRRTRQNGDVRVVEWSEGSLYAALDASARGLPSMPCGTAAASDVVAGNDNLKVAPDPFSGAPVVYARALTPDVALLHVADASPRGDLYIDGDAGFDLVTACSARSVVVSADRIVERSAHAATISRVWVDTLVHAPDGAWPTACYPVAGVDADALRAWMDSRGDLASLARTAR